MSNDKLTVEQREKARRWLERDIRLSRKAFESRLNREGNEDTPRLTERTVNHG